MSLNPPEYSGVEYSLRPNVFAYMSQSRVGNPIVQSVDPSAPSVERVVDETTIQLVLDALDDADCRAILEATSNDPLTARTVSETCDLPLSTTYRKLDLLVDAGLLEERTRVRRSGKHTSEYGRLIEAVFVSLHENGALELLVSFREDI